MGKDPDTLFFLGPPKYLSVAAPQQATTALAAAYIQSRVPTTLAHSRFLYTRENTCGTPLEIARGRQNLFFLRIFFSRFFPDMPLYPFERASKTASICVVSIFFHVKKLRFCKKKHILVIFEKVLRGVPRPPIFLNKT